MKYKLNLGMWNSVFAVPNSIIDDHIKLCGGVSFKVLMLLLRHSEYGISVDDISAILSLSCGDVNDALNYWIKEKIICSDENSSDVKNTIEAKVQPILEVDKAFEKPIEHESEQKLVKVSSSKSSLSRNEVHQMISSDLKLENLIHETQQIMGKALTSAEMETIASLYSYYGLACDFILMAIQYCCSINKINMRYIEKTIASWVDLGIDTHEKAEEYIIKLIDFSSKENQVRSAFGINGRSLISKEEKYIRTWFYDYNFDIAMIKLAYERTVEKIGKLSFAYTNTILESWYKKGIKTPKDASMEKSPTWQPKNDDDNATPKHAPSRKSSYDIDELEKMIYSDYGKED